MDISAVSSAERRQGRIETLPSFETFAKAVANIFHSVKAEQAVTSMA